MLRRGRWRGHLLNQVVVVREAIPREMTLEMET